MEIASLAAFRVIFGTVMCFGILRFIATGWIEPMYVEPHWFFTYPGCDWIRPWPAWGMYLHYGVLALLALAIALGVFHRIVTMLFVLGFAYTQLIDVTNYLNHHYLVVLLGVQLALLPANAAWSIDAWRRPATRRATIPAWMLWLLRFQVGVVYVFAGLAKAKLDWLIHGQPLNLWLAARTDTPIIGSLLDEPWAGHALAWAGFLYDSTIVVWLSWARTRRYAFLVLIVFHALTGYLFNIGMFPLIMTSSALIFFAPGWPRRVVEWLGKRPETRPGTRPETRPETRPGTRPGTRLGTRQGAAVVGEAEPREARAPSRFVIGVIALHVTVQLAVPLRHHVYPGSVLWNEDGMRFAWHVLIREKQGTVMFVAVFADGKRLEVPPRNYLTARQEREMGGQPDLILQLARAIGRDLAERGYRDFQIRAITAVSLNGRAPEPLIDPTVDLLQISDVGERTWVLPSPARPPPTVTPLR